MAPRGRKKKAGMMREDAARDAMRAFGFAERLINVSIKELLEVYGAEGWFLIEECSYLVLLNKCLEKSAEQGPNLPQDRVEEEQNDEMMAEAEKDQNDEMVVVAEEAEPEQNHEMMVEAEQEHTPQQEEEEKEQEEQRVEDGRDHVGSNSTSLLGCVAETGTKACQTEALSTTSETDILDSSPAAGEASVIDYTSPPAAFPPAGFAQHPSAGANLSGRGGWISDSDEDEDPDDDGDDDDEMIQLTPEPLCEELEELIKEIRGEKKKKRTRWED